MTTGTCPVCNGTKHMPCPEGIREYAVRHGSYGYNASDDTVDCDNCGSQMQWGKATGQVPRRADGSLCKHEYTSSKVGRCLTKYSCMHCNHMHVIDSGD